MPHQAFKALSTAVSPVTHQHPTTDSNPENIFQCFCWFTPSQDSGKRWGSVKRVYSPVRIWRGIHAKILNELFHKASPPLPPPPQEWCFSQLIIPTKHSGTGREKASLHMTGAQSPFWATCQKESGGSRKGWEARKLRGGWQQGEKKSGDKVRRQTCRWHAAQDVSRLDAVMKMYWLRGNEATRRLRCHDCAPGCYRDCCSPTGDLNTHRLHANPPVLASDFVLS